MSVQYHGFVKQVQDYSIEKTWTYV